MNRLLSWKRTARNFRRIYHELVSWKWNLLQEDQLLAEVQFRKGIIRGDSLSIVIFFIAIIQLSYIVWILAFGISSWLFRIYPTFSDIVLLKTVRKYRYSNVYGWYKNICQKGKKTKKTFETLIQTIRINFKDIWMEFGVGKCATLTIKSGEREKAK